MGLAKRVAVDHNKLTKEEQFAKSIQTIIKSTWFTDWWRKPSEDTHASPKVFMNEMPLLTKSLMKKIIAVDGSKTYAVKYLEAIQEALEMISSVCCVANNKTIKKPSWKYPSKRFWKSNIDDRDKVKILSKKPQWPDFNFVHRKLYDKHVLSCSYWMLDECRDLNPESKPEDEDRLRESGKSFCIGARPGNTGGAELDFYIILDDSLNVDYILFDHLSQSKSFKSSISRVFNDTERHWKRGEKVCIEDVIKERLGPSYSLHK
jgi:hypothetical protein